MQNEILLRDPEVQRNYRDMLRTIRRLREHPAMSSGLDLIFYFLECQFS